MFYEYLQHGTIAFQSEMLDPISQFISRMSGSGIASAC